MNVKQWAVFFVCILSCDYFIRTVSAVAADRGLSCCKRKRLARQTSCRLRPEAVRALDDCLERVRVALPDSVDLPDQEVDEYMMSEGRASGFQNFERKQYRCICSRDSVRVVVRISFLRILITYVISLLNSLLGGLLGSLGSALAGLLGNVVNLLLRILALDIIVEITIVQRFIPGTTCRVESYRVSKLVTITLLGLDLAPIAELLSPILTPVLDLVLQLIFRGRVRAIFVREFEKIILQRSWVTCP